MKSVLLLPHKYKKIGWALFVPSLILGIYVAISSYEFPFLTAKVFSLFSDTIFKTNADKPVAKVWFESVNLTNTLAGLVLIVSCLLIGFSKEKNEDEYIEKLRLSSLLWAVLVNSFLLIVAFTCVYGTVFFSVMTYNMFTVLLLFIFRFQYLLYRSNKILSDEKQY